MRTKLIVAPLNCWPPLAMYAHRRLAQQMFAEQATQHRAEFELFQRTMAAPESLHQNDLQLTAMSKASEQTMRRLDENLARLTDNVVDHHDKLTDHRERLDELES